MTNYLEKIKETLVKPTLLILHKFDEEKMNYYLYIKEKKMYLLVIVKYLNGEGEIITSFLTRKIIRR